LVRDRPPGQPNYAAVSNASGTDESRSTADASSARARGLVRKEDVPADGQPLVRLRHVKGHHADTTDVKRTDAPAALVA
jgi:hypothetical protein